MSNLQISLMTQKIEKLAKEAKFKKIPELKISKDKHLLAKASLLRKRVTVGAQLLSQWQKGEIDESDVEVILAHEIGHLMDFERNFHSVIFRYDAIVVLYFVLGVGLPKLAWSPQLSEAWMTPLFAFLAWAFLLPWILRTAALAVQFEADRNATRLINVQQIADSIAKRTRFYRTKGFGLIRTWELLLRVILFPSLSERLENLNFEIKESKIEIQKIENGQSLSHT